MIWTKVFGIISFLVGCWFGMVWSEGPYTICRSIHSSQNSLYPFHPFFQNHNGGKYLGGNEFNQFRPPNISHDLCLLFCLYPSPMGCPWLSPPALATPPQSWLCWCRRAGSPGSTRPPHPHPPRPGGPPVCTACTPSPRPTPSCCSWQSESHKVVLSAWKNDIDTKNRECYCVGTVTFAWNALNKDP